MPSHTIRSITLAGLLLAVTVSTAQAGLTWQRRDVSVDAKPTQKQVEADYPFKNTGEQPVTITKVTSSCGCTTAALEKKTYQPGESGRIRATFEVGHRSGKQTKRIVVRTDADGSPATTLTLRADIPELLRLSRRFVFWKADEPREAKTIELTVVHDEPVTVTGVRPSSDAVTAELAAVEDGKRYMVTLTPGAKPSHARLLIDTKLADGKTKTFSALVATVAQPVES